MSVKYRKLWVCFAVLSAVVFMPRLAAAQIYWQITHGRAFDSSYYEFSGLSGKGNWFTAAARKRSSKSILALTFVFLRSNDGGMTWAEQDPVLPPTNSANHDEFNVLDQIDSLNVIAGSKYGIILRTFDGGKTWKKQSTGSDTAYVIADINFSDPMNGILTDGGHANQIWTTSDGGENWLPAPFKAIVNQCHTTGPGHYKVFEYGDGPLYKTDDNWLTVDTAYVSDSLMNPNKVLGYCEFGSNDLMFAYGSHWQPSGYAWALVARTSDGGKTWQDTTINYFEDVLYMTDPDRDTIVATGSTINYILISVDHGITWVKDTSIVGDNAQLNDPDGIFWNLDDHIVAAFGNQYDGYGYLVVGTFSQSKVQKNSLVVNPVGIYPNPSSQTINIESLEAGKLAQVLDILGREVLHGTVPPTGSLTVDISSLPAGLYYVSDGLFHAKFVKK